MQKRQFTLVELLVVIVIMMLLVAIAVPVYSRIMNGSAVGHAARMVSSQLNLARTEACSRRKTVAVVFANSAMNYDAAKAPMLDRRAFRSCYLKDNTMEFEAWVPGTKWEVVPTGATISVPTGSGTITVPADKEADFKEDFFSGTAGLTDTVVFQSTGRPNLNGAASGRRQVKVTEGILTTNGGTIVKPNADNCISVYVNAFTGGIVSKQAE